MATPITFFLKDPDGFDGPQSAVTKWLTELEDKNPTAYEALGSADIARLRELLEENRP